MLNYCIHFNVNDMGAMHVSTKLGDWDKTGVLFPSLKPPLRSLVVGFRYTLTVDYANACVFTERSLWQTLYVGCGVMQMLL